MKYNNFNESENNYACQNLHPIDIAFNKTPNAVLNLH